MDHGTTTASQSMADLQPWGDVAALGLGGHHNSLD
jgi:hypothetical protein